MKRDFQQLPTQATPLPYAVPSLADLPGSLKQAAGLFVDAIEQPASICVFPGRTVLKNWVGWENIPEQALLFTDKAVIHLQAAASPGQPARTVFLHAADLLVARLSLILMYGRLELVDQNLSRVVVEFNAAGFEIIQAGLQSLLGAACASASVSVPAAVSTQTHLHALGRLSYKFKNGLVLYGLLPGEQVLGFVFQPTIWERRWHLFPLKVAETTLLALTDRQLIVVEEQSRSRFPAYGWIFTFHPRHTLEKIGITSDRCWQELTVALQSGSGLHDRSILLEEPNALAWQELWSRYGVLCTVT